MSTIKTVDSFIVTYLLAFLESHNYTQFDVRLALAIDASYISGFKSEWELKLITASENKQVNNKWLSQNFIFDQLAAMPKNYTWYSAKVKKIQLGG